MADCRGKVSCFSNSRRLNYEVSYRTSYQLTYQVGNSPSSSKLSTLAERVVEPNKRTTDEDEDEDALFAELEDEIENDDNPALRERGLAALRKE